MTNQDTDATPKSDQWNNGSGLDMAAELNRMMTVRRAALDRFDETSSARTRRWRRWKEALVPLYMYHRYAVEAAASAVGRARTISTRSAATAARRPDGCPAAQQKAALDALAATLKPSELALPKNALEKIPPRPSGWGMHRELFARYTGDAFRSDQPGGDCRRRHDRLHAAAGPRRAHGGAARARSRRCPVSTDVHRRAHDGDVKAPAPTRTSRRSAAPRRGRSSSA
jgi:hypothetical protein